MRAWVLPVSSRKICDIENLGPDRCQSLPCRGFPSHQPSRTPRTTAATNLNQDSGNRRRLSPRSNSIGCVGARICNTNNCPAGIATQKPELRKRLNVDVGAQRLANYLGASVELMQVLARACGYRSLSEFQARDLTSWKKDMAELAGVRFAGE